MATRIRKIVRFFHGKSVEVSVATDDGDPFRYPAREVRGFRASDIDHIATLSPTRKSQGIEANPRSFRVGKGKATFEPEDAAWTIIDGSRTVRIEEAVEGVSEFAGVFEGYRAGDVRAASAAGFVDFLTLVGGVEIRP